jgi:hypothetical protein
MKNYTNMYLPAAVFLLMGVGVFLFMLLSLIEDAGFRSHAVMTTGVISAIDKIGDNNYSVIVEYRANGRGFEKKLDYWSSDMKIGQQIQVWHNPSFPERMSAGGLSDQYVLIIAPIVFTVIGVVMVKYTVKEKRRVDNLVKHGEKISATIYKIEKIGVGKNTKYVLMCEYKDPIGNRQVFKSGYIHKRSSRDLQRLQECIGRPIEVYVESGDYSEYVVNEKSAY